MKREVKRLLKEMGRDLFTESRYELVVMAFKLARKESAWLKTYTDLDPLNKAQWIADHICKFYDCRLFENENPT